MDPSRPLTITLIGFGEVGRIFAAGFLQAGAGAVRAYDILFDGADGTLKRTAADAGVRACASTPDAVAGADVVISAVTASSALDVARAAAPALGAGQIFFDINSVSPATKRACAEIVEAAGGRYVEAAVMASVPPYGLRVPMLLGGPRAEEAAGLMRPFGMRLDVAGDEIGRASAIKMCRSVMIKGIEALTVESMLAAHAYGVQDEVVASLDETFPGLDWPTLAGYLMSRVVQHGTRRAAEMRESARTVAEAGIEPLMTSAIAERQQWVADRRLASAVSSDDSPDFRKLAALLRTRT